MCSISYTIYWCRVYLSRVKCRYNWIVHAECRFRTKMKQSWKGVTGIGSPNTARPELQPFLCRDPLHSCESPFSNWWMFHCVWLPVCSSMWQFHHLSMGSIFETYREQTLRCWNQGNSGRSSSVSLFPNPFFQQIPNKNPIIHPDCYHFKTGWWFQICLFYVHPYFKGKIPILASIFFRWVETSSGAISGRIVGEVVSFFDLKLAHPGAESFHQKKQIQLKLQTSGYYPLEV